MKNITTYQTRRSEEIETVKIEVTGDTFTETTIHTPESPLVTTRPTTVETHKIETLNLFVSMLTGLGYDLI